MKRPRLEVNVARLDETLDQACHSPLSEADCQMIKSLIHRLIEMVVARRSSEKTREVSNAAQPTAESGASTNPSNPAQAAQPTPCKTPGHGRTPASAYTGAHQVHVSHPHLQPGSACPECPKGKVYPQKEPRLLVRIVGQAPLSATVYHLEELRCNACGKVYPAPAPEGVGSEKYDATAVAMIAQLKYGSGVPFYRIEQLEERMGVPLPAANQWELVRDRGEWLQPVWKELIRQAALGEVFHNDDTGMRILKLERPEGDQRSGVFTSAVLSVRRTAGDGATVERRIAVYGSGREHAGENLEKVMEQRPEGMPPVILMSDALPRNKPKAIRGVELLWANCMSHGRRNFVEVVESFPSECRYVLERLGMVYANDAEAQERNLTRAERLAFHQEQSQSVMDELKQWMEEQFQEKKVEPNSGLGKAMRYMQKHWSQLTLFLREPGAPLDNNICERALKLAVLHRKNALFYRTKNGAQIGDLFMSLIHTCQLNDVNSFDYLVELFRHVKEAAVHPEKWMPWCYRDALTTA